ncbi:MAG: FHA domain-containing protein [Acidobacteriota bacterium]
MPAELILKQKDIPETAAEVRVPMGRFTLGRSPESDLPVNVAGISRRHAIISNFADAAQISDCGSQNGTFVNGRPVASATALQDGDVISLGGVCELTVEWRAAATLESTVPLTTAAAAPSLVIDEGTEKLPATQQAGMLNAPVNAPNAAAGTLKFNATQLAIIAAVAIVFFAGVAIGVAKLLGGTNTSKGQEPEPTLATSSPESGAIETPSPQSNRPCGALTPEEVEAAAQLAVQRICNDPMRLSFPADGQTVQRVKQIIEQHCGSASLASQINILRQSKKALVALTEDQVDPDLLAYAALAKTVNAGADPLAKARAMAPVLNTLRAKLGYDTAESTLLFVAAYGLGPGQLGRHPLLDRMNRAKIEKRTVWEVCRRGLLDPEDCDFINYFLALGIIAHNPQRFAIKAESLDF